MGKATTEKEKAGIADREIENFLHTVKNITQAGNLSIRFTTDQDSRLSELGHELNNMLDRFETIFGDIGKLTSEISKVSLHTMSSIAEQNAVASQQSASVTEITSTMEELSATSRQIAMNASSVLTIAEEGGNNAQEGVSSIEDLENRMKVIEDVNDRNSKEIIELGRKSGEISKVMEIIKTIAGQTRLIAFNAALEAASAGESGKRFGIVAVEIRRLADNVTDSTKEIAENISEIQSTVNKLVISSEKSQSEIQNGVNEVAQTRNVLKSIQESTHANADAARQISTSTQQQNTASNQVVIAIKEISAGAQSNAKTINDTGRQIEQLAEMSTDLEKKIHEFETGDGMLEWNPLFELGIADIDSQHREMVAAMDAYYQDLVAKKDTAPALKNMKNSVAIHLTNEEEMMKKYQFDDRESHVEEHGKFLKFVEDLEAGKNNPQIVFRQLKNWLNKHILIQDKKYSVFFERNGIKF